MQSVILKDPNGFIIFDLEDAPVSLGVARAAKSVLRSSAESLARSVTYSFAAFGIQGGGASAAINGEPDQLDANIATLVGAAAELASGGRLALDPGLGLNDGQLAPMRAHDPRPQWLLGETNGVPARDHLVAAGAISAAETVNEGACTRRIAIEGFGQVGLAIAKTVASHGGKVVAIATREGTALAEDGFDIEALAAAFAADGDAMVKNIGTAKPAWAIFGAAADTLFVGSRPGCLTHEGAAHVKASAVVPIGPVPFTTKALLTMERASAVVVPDFVSLAGPILAGFGAMGGDVASAAGAVGDAVGAILRGAANHEDGLFLGLCDGAETFLRSWNGSVPFGRPLA